MAIPESRCPDKAAMKRKRLPEPVERALEEVAPDYRSGEPWYRSALRWALIAILAAATGWLVVTTLIKARPKMPPQKAPPIVIELVPSKP